MVFNSVKWYRRGSVTRMELVNVDGLNASSLASNNIPQANHQVPIQNQPTWLQRHATVICLTTIICITFLIYFLFIWPIPFELDHSSDLKRSVRQVYINKLNESQTRSILVSTDSSCNQRKHDARFGFKCESSKIEECNNIKPVIRPVSTTTITSVVTSKSGSRFKVDVESHLFVDCDANIDKCRFETKLNANFNDLRQEIIGWGGAFTDSSLYNIRGLSESVKQRLLDDYHDTDSGLGFNIIRITIGGSDFSLRFYTNDDSDEDDLALAKSRLMEEDTEYKIPMLKYIKQRYPNIEFKMFASMWSPPIWMKTNGHFNKGQIKGKMHHNLTRRHPDEVYFEALANLKKKFLLAYHENSIDFWGLTVMNEPIFAVQPFLDFNTMIFPMDDYGAYVVKYLGPIIKSNPILGNIKLMLHDDNRKFLLTHTYPLLRKVKSLLNYTDGISVHGYADERYDLMDWSELKKYNLFILPTELCSGHLPFMEKALIGNWHRGVHYGLDIIRSLQNQAAGWVDWNMALDTTGGPGWLGGRLDSPIIVDRENDAYYRNPMFYVLGHFSRFIPPGSRRVKSTLVFGEYDYPLEEVTFLLPNRKDITTVILNNNPYTIKLLIKLDADGEKFRKVTLDADSISTLLYVIE